MKLTLTLLIALLTPLAASHAGDTPQPPVKVTQKMLNAIHTRPKLIFDPMPAYGQKYLPFAMAASMESTSKGRLWTCWAGGQDGPNAYLLRGTPTCKPPTLIDSPNKACALQTTTATAPLALPAAHLCSLDSGK